MTLVKIGRRVLNVDHWFGAGGCEMDNGEAAWGRVVDLTGLDAFEMEAAIEQLLRPVHETDLDLEPPSQSWRDR